MNHYIRLRGLRKHFRQGENITRAVDGIDLDIGAGEIVAMLGPNGAGKTTTLDMILGFTDPSAGRVEVFGGPPRAAVADGRMSAVLQTGGLLRDLTVAETVELIASTHRTSDPLSDVLERSGLAGLADRPVRACSGGEQQRLRFALALLADPDLLLLDEPTAGMDVESRRAFWVTISEQADRGRTVLFATHYLHEAEDHARRTVVLTGGRLVADGPTDEIRRRATTRTVRATVAPDRIERVTATLQASGLLAGADIGAGVAGSVGGLTIQGDRVIVETNDSDAVAQCLLGEFGGTNLEVEAASLERAFVHLTADRNTATDHPETVNADEPAPISQGVAS